MREYLRRAYIKPVLRFFLRIGMVVGIILLFDVIGVWFFLFSKGQWDLASFLELLTILLLLEGAFTGAGGALMFYGYSEYRVAREAAINPAIAGDQVRRWRERRLSQQKWGLAMVVAGVLLIFLGLLVSFLTSL